jgi:hypothetical protein
MTDSVQGTKNACNSKTNDPKIPKSHQSFAEILRHKFGIQSRAKNEWKRAKKLQVQVAVTQKFQPTALP